MTTTATHNAHDNTPARVLLVAFALREQAWKLGCPTGHGQQPRERTVAARQQGRGRPAVAQAKSRFGLPETAPVVSCYEAGRDGFWRHRFGQAKGSPTLWSIPPLSKSIVASVGPRVMGWTCASC